MLLGLAQVAEQPAAGLAKARLLGALERAPALAVELAELSAKVANQSPVERVPAHRVAPQRSPGKLKAPALRAPQHGGVEGAPAEVVDRHIAARSNALV